MSDRGGAAPPAPAPAAMAVTDHQIAETLESLLRVNNYTTLNAVVQHLESKLGVNLSHKIDFIHAQIQHLYLRHQQQNFTPQHHHQERFAVHQNPKITAPPAPAPAPAPAPHANPNFAAHHPEEGYGFRPTPQQPQLSPAPPPPTPTVVVKNPSVPTGSVSAKESAPSPTAKKRRGGPGGLNKLCGVSPELQTIVGQPTLPRTEIVKQLWAYIRKNNLQDPNNKRKIICNDELRLVFETDCTDMFKMNKLLAKHILPLEPTKQTAQNAKKQKVDVVKSESKSDDTVPIVMISVALASFFGTDEKEMSQPEVLRQMWEYIKVNQLEDPLNPMAIVCDAKLRELLGCESISALGMPETLAQRHLYKKS